MKILDTHFFVYYTTSQNEFVFVTFEDNSKSAHTETKWAAPWQNQHSAFAANMNPDKPVHPRSLIRIHAVRYQFLYLLLGL
jgi:hypothetical protein